MYDLAEYIAMCLILEHLPNHTQCPEQILYYALNTLNVSVLRAEQLHAPFLVKGLS